MRIDPKGLQVTNLIAIIMNNANFLICNMFHRNHSFFIRHFFTMIVSKIYFLQCLLQIKKFALFIIIAIKFVTCRADPLGLSSIISDHNAKIRPQYVRGRIKSKLDLLVKYTEKYAIYASSCSHKSNSKEGLELDINLHFLV